MMTTNQKQGFVIAIDFGTSHSGFAYARHGEEKSIEALYEWPGSPAPYPKTLSALLLDDKLAVKEWGYAAQNKYMRSAKKNELHYLTRFKLHLDEEWAKTEDARRNQLPDGGVIPIIGNFLAKMKERIATEMTTKFGSGFSMDETHWCLTVPAMWSDRAKHLMRKAAAFAGLIEEPSSQRLTIILEPEAAALYVANDGQRGELQHNDVFMILDAGGGTVDLTALRTQISPDGSKQFMEVAPGLGESCGSTFVDDQFIEFFKCKVGAEAFDKGNAAKPEELIRIMKEFEGFKRQFVGVDAHEDDEDDHAGQINIPKAMAKEMTDEAKQALLDAAGDEDSVFITPTDMAGLFDPVLDKIMSLCDEMIQRCKDHDAITKILCVGGFSDSKYLVRRVRERYEPQNIQVICPSDPGATVVKGAVQYGLKPNAIASRRARLTYGLAVRGYWNDSMPLAKRSWDGYQKTWMVEDKFDTLVRVGDEIRTDQQAVRTYFPPAIWSTCIRLSLYATASPTPMFVDEPGCRQLAEIQVPLQLRQDKSINDYPLQITVSFGSTEIQIHAKNSKTGEVISTSTTFKDDPEDLKEDVPAAGTKRTRGSSSSPSASPTKRVKPAA